MNSARIENSKWRSCVELPEPWMRWVILEVDTTKFGLIYVPAIVDLSTDNWVDADGYRYDQNTQRWYDKRGEYADWLLSPIRWRELPGGGK